MQIIREVTMPQTVKAIPDSYHSLTPNLVCRNAAAAIDFYKKVFEATEIMRMPGPNGTISHSELKIGDSIFFVNDPMGTNPTPAPAPGSSNAMSLHVYVQDVDSVFNRAVAGGSRVDLALQNMFWGDRFGRVTDPFGQQWGIATHIEDVAPDEMERRQKALFAKSAG
jgi:PhnB protein